MKIILLEDVPALGHRGEVRNVADGYARNYLIPQRLALLASSSNLKNLVQIKKRQETIAQQVKADAQSQAQVIEALVFSLSRQASEEGRLYGSVTAQDLAAFLSQNGVHVEKHRVGLAEPIKAVGEHSIPIRLHPEVTVPLRVSVSRE
jgi:large subunit ribosomal protein L9